MIDNLSTIYPNDILMLFGRVCVSVCVFVCICFFVRNTSVHSENLKKKRQKKDKTKQNKTKRKKIDFYFSPFLKCFFHSFIFFFKFFSSFLFLKNLFQLIIFCMQSKSTIHLSLLLVLKQFSTALACSKYQ